MGDLGAERRVLDGLGIPDVVGMLAGLPGSDLTTLLLAVMRARSTAVTSPDILRAYADGRFVVPADVGFDTLRRTENYFLSALDDEWTRVMLSPLVPFGTHAATGQVSQDWVVSTVRGNEVAADPTNGLCLEVAARRRKDRTLQARLATVQRIVRGQRYEGAPSHFTIFALVTGGRDVGSSIFESAAIAEQVSIHVRGIRAAGARSIRVLLTDLTDGSDARLMDNVRSQVAPAGDLSIQVDDQREGGRSYYEGICFKIRADLGQGEIEVTDGGLTRWTAALLQDQKERLCISGSGLDNVAAAIRLRRHGPA